MKGRDRFWERLLKLSTLKIVLIYIAVGALWIMFSDLLIFQAASNSTMYAWLSIGKGWLYVAVTSLLLYWLISRYISERTRIEESLADEKGQAELFLDVMGHDITNLNQIGIGYLELAMATLDTGAEGKELLVKPLIALQNSSKLIDNVRKLRRARKDSPTFYRVDVAPVLLGLVRTYSDYPGREVEITCSGRDCQVLANDLLPDVFSGVVEYALKTSTSPLHLTVQLAGACMGDKEYCRVSIEDNGPGIPDSLKKALFIRPLGVARTSSGVLSLYLAWILVNQYGGLIWVEDRVPGDFEKGSRFVIMLPAAR